MNHFKKIYVLADEYPEEVFIDGKKYQRFLGCYLPCELYELDRGQLSELNQIRLDLDLVDWDYNKYMNRLLFDKATNGKQSGKLLDFGIGNGLSVSILKDTNWDISGIDVCSYRDNKATIYNWDSIKELGLKFDAVISCFVFDFNVTWEDIRNLYDCLKEDGKMVFNVYKFWDHGEHFKEILMNLEKVDFYCKIEKIVVPKGFQVRHKMDMIVTCLKS